VSTDASQSLSSFGVKCCQMFQKTFLIKRVAEFPVYFLSSMIFEFFVPLFIGFMTFSSVRLKLRQAAGTRSSS
jgi:hypothetical protein